jgi:hypothetical protein
VAGVAVPPDLAGNNQYEALTQIWLRSEGQGFFCITHLWINLALEPSTPNH